MLHPFLTRCRLNNVSFFSLDFYRFKHTEETIVSSDKKQKIQTRPLWVVGISPFDPELSEESGHIVHLGYPRFTARWTLNDELIEQIDTPDYYDEDLNMIIYDVIPLDGSEGPSEEWLLEAVCAVGYSRGLITMAPAIEKH
ncbi:MAG: hypothetical protein AB7E52_00265 [Bdellovibrionales bacterium]